ncbi:hypothetical protein Glove_18g157 [Diversispora epigaea]|uniref:Uncharacterized protein n=1 Tax=Diversispora epigaea TaxID=1348612 RepID=A0A397JVA6_9GLOM|nr:hypothetical protein Glove_18g157 [Diversispora epigaea]
MKIYDFDTESNENYYSFNELLELNVFEYNKENYTKAFLILEQKTSNKNDENEEDYEEYNIDFEIQEFDLTLKTNFSPCVLFDYINNKLQMCGQIASKNICQLIGTWQIDNKAVSEFQSKGISLGVCMNHFNYDQKNHNAFTKQLQRIESSEVQHRRYLLCFKNNYFFNRSIRWVSEKVLEEVPTVHYICYSCYELYGGHLNLRLDPGKRKFTCE